MNRGIYYTLALLLGWCCFTGLDAQKVTALLDREKILLGEQAELQLKLEDFNSRTTLLSSWFILPDTANHIEFVRKASMDTIEVNGYTTYLQKIAITSFDSGKWQLPPLQLVIKDQASGKEMVVKAEDLFLEVLPLDVSSLKEYHEMKDIAEVTVPDYTWLMVAGILVLALVALWMARWLTRRKKARPVRPLQPTLGNPLSEALRQLARLKEETTAGNQQIKQRITRLDQVVRQYLESTVYPGSLQQTSDELMIALGPLLVKEELRTGFYQLLRLCDAAKFAKYLPAVEQQQEAIATAIHTLQQIDSLLPQKTTHANGVV